MSLIPIPGPRTESIPHRPRNQHARHSQDQRRSDVPEEHIAVLIDDRHRVEVHAKVASEKREWKEEARDQGELPHALVLRSGNRVEDERSQVLCGPYGHVRAGRHCFDVVLDVL